ncbi:N-acetyltransferase [Micromonospora chokoriensis]
MNLTQAAGRLATAEDVSALSTVVTSTLMSGPLSTWLVPDAADRPAVMRLYADAVLTHGVKHGQVYTTDERAAVAVSYSQVQPPSPSDGIGDGIDLPRVLGPHAHRFVTLHTLTDYVFPHRPHHYIAQLAARAGQWTAARMLLATLNEGLDAQDLPAYAEISSPCPRETVFAQLGYVPRSPILLAEGGPVLWRMWRPPLDPRLPGGLPRRVRLHRAAAQPLQVMPAASPATQ